MKFISNVGTFGKGWNSIRLGETWVERVRPGDFVALVNKKNVSYGTALVQKVISGSRAEILKNHAYKNHELIEQNLSKEKAAKILDAEMRQIFGDKIYKPDSRLTVIYLDTL